jgi:aspartyl-tRNA(Asn)/glutamyl-tRNA(Gln) amidotransferase subunit A
MSATAESQVAAALGNMRQIDPRLHSLLESHDESAVARAKSLDGSAGGRGAMHGMPVLLKDNICTRAGTTTCASKILAGYRSPYDAHVVELLEQAGAVIVGKTNLDEFAMGSSTENSSRFTTVNPWDLERVAGGSSGGSVAAVAARLVPFALGSETGGSVRQPASLCGVCGLKPTYGRVSRYGLVAFASSLDQIGPVAVDVRGIALLLRTIAGHDSRDSTSVNEPVPDYVAGLDQPIGKVRIGIPREYFGEGLNDEVRSGVLAAVEVYKKLGATVHDVSLPHTKYTIPVYYLIATAEASSNLARFDGVRYGHRTREPADYIDSYSSSRAEGFGAEVKRRIMLGTYALSSGYYDAYYLKALKVRTLIKRDFTQAFGGCDVILSPTTPTAAFKVGEKSNNPLEMYLSDIYTTAANLAGIPAISIPCGLTQSGLPIGLQLMAPAFAEDRLLRIAHAFQQATNHHTLRPPICAA